jgi:hypothetical protein
MSYNKALALNILQQIEDAILTIQKRVAGIHCADGQK